MLVRAAPQHEPGLEVIVMSRWLPLFVCSAALVVFDARALSPGPPRPFPGDLLTSGQCSNHPLVSCSDQAPCDLSEDENAICLAIPGSAEVVAGAAVRATLTLIVDEDVTGWEGGAVIVDGTSEDAFLSSAEARNDRARLTLLLEFQARGKPFATAETFALDRTCSVDDPSYDPSPGNRRLGDPSLCLGGTDVSSWNEPISETNLIKPLGPGGRPNRFGDIALQWTRVNPDLRKVILDALLTPADRTKYPNAEPLFEVVDAALRGDPLSSTQTTQLDQFDHQGGDPLASVRRFKVTIRVATGVKQP